MRRTLISNANRTFTGRELRRNFIDYFRNNGHEVIASSSVRPLSDDSSLLFTNAGMNQFKGIILGDDMTKRKIVSVQKCIRAGGKHNDLDDVGKDLHHQTFFEMLGNWSFNNAYSKEESCKLAWNYLTNELGIDPNRLYISYFGGSKNFKMDADLESRDIWRSIGVPNSRILPFEKDNFWEMGASGPCGPCTEIHFDRSENPRQVPHLVNVDDSVVEIWNIVFMQKFRGLDGRIVPLSSQHIDTGMGFERLVSVVQGVNSNFDTDLFLPIFDEIEQMSKMKYTRSLRSQTDFAFRLLTDHLRCVVVAVSDGVEPGSTDSGFVIRKMLRRAFLQASKVLGIENGVSSLVPVVVETLRDAYKFEEDSIIKTIDLEEEQFWKVVNKGSKMFEKISKRAGIISGADAFTLQDTHGLSIEITEELARQKGLSVDTEGYRKLKEESKKLSQKWSSFNINHKAGEFQDQAKYEYTLAGNEHEFPMVVTNIERVFDDQNQPVDALSGHGAVILKNCQFYAEEGGQKPDHGLLMDGENPIFHVTNVKNINGVAVVFGNALKRIKNGDVVIQKIDKKRRGGLMRAHSATHLLNEALRRVGLGAGQRGSSVDEDALRFDYELTLGGSDSRKEKIQEVERLIQEKIRSGCELKVEQMDLDLAKNLSGMQSVFREDKSYPETVRVCSFIDPSGNDCAVECCSGTHVLNTRTIEDFVITSEKASAKGIRRILALTGEKAKLWREQRRNK